MQLWSWRKIFSPRVLASALFIATALLLIVLIKKHSEGQISDPDHFYHMAFSRELVKNGPILRTLPQVEDLGWGDLIREKEFLFHQFTALGYRIGGEAGVRYTALVFSALILIGICLGAQLWLEPLLAICLAAGFLYSNAFFIDKIMQLRPHSLAILLFVLLLLACVKNKKNLFAAACALFCLSYHAFFLPLFICALAAGIFLWRRDPAWKQMALFGFAGIVLGTAINPYFPMNLLAGIQHIKVAFAAGNGALPGFGMELIPGPTNLFLRTFGHFFLALFLLTVFSMRRIELKKPSGAELQLLLLLSTALGLWVLSFLSPKAMEYAIPSSCLAMAAAIGYLRLPKKWLAPALLLPLIFTGLPAYWRSSEASELGRQIIRNNLEQWEALDKIPVPAPGAPLEKIYNCSWAMGPNILYRRPDLKFVDLLDPTFLAEYSPALFELRNQLNAGKIADPLPALKNVFKADYLLCNQEALTRQLDYDPAFSVLFQGKTGLRLYKISPAADEYFLRAYELRAEASQAEWKPFSSEQGRFLDLWQGLHALGVPPHQEPGREYCVRIRPALEKYSKLPQVKYLGMGGGMQLQAWLNGKPLFHTRLSHPKAELIHTLVPIPQALSPRDSLEVKVCSPMNANFGFALSLWNSDSLARLCRPQAASEEAWSYTDTPVPDCLLPIAALETGNSLRSRARTHSP